jgi:two-component system, response regulator
VRATAAPTTILVADDDADDRLMIEEAFDECRLAGEIHVVENGEELIQYLRREGQFRHLSGYPFPRVILLDLNMPRKDGREALREIKSDPDLCRIPIVVLTTSHAEEDIVGSYRLGVSSFITKPATFEGLVDAMKVLSRYWMEIVSLPPECCSPRA